jgi:hypothetical protein
LLVTHAAIVGGFHKSIPVDQAKRRSANGG